MMVKTWYIFLLILIVLSAVSCETSSVEGGIDPVVKFLGSWKVSDTPARINYNVTIERSTLNSDQVILNNFGDLGGSAIGLVVNNTIVIDNQDIGGGFQSEGSGNYINEDELKLEFFLDDGIDKELRKATFTK